MIRFQGYEGCLLPGHSVAVSSSLLPDGWQQVDGIAAIALSWRGKKYPGQEGSLEVTQSWPSTAHLLAHIPS